MIPVDMLVKHDPENGIWGDCTRACIASILELPAEEVPHFCHDGEVPLDPNGNAPWANRCRAWLNERGFDFLYFDIREPAHHFHPDCVPFHYMVGGLTARGTRHFVVYHGGKLAHDPHPTDKAGLTDQYPQDVMVLVKR